ncbi:CU044_5270 family protein [Kitasatospora mediocidica]|uniref:CU044_5270 family protein n=1 Tax=Kitasatospora mediocidica TaxID=58352 RepID=UPI000564F3BC|nr:CU044_5270 family protein [Kitasatospora mediocidica]
MNDASPMLTAERHRLLKDHLMSEIARQERAPRPRRRAGWLLAAPLAVAAVAAVTLVVPAPHASRPGTGTPPALPPPSASASVASPLPTPSPEPTDAAGLLGRAVDALRTRPAPQAAPGQFTYRREIQEGASETRHERTSWLSVDGRLEGLIVDPTMTGAGNPDGRNPWPPTLGAGQGAPTVASFDTPTYAFVAALPTDPQALEHRLLYDDTQYAVPAMTDALRPQAAFSHVQMIFQNIMAPPPVAAALMQAAARIPGTVLLADDVDADGRHGVALAHDGGGLRVSLIFDPRSGAFLGVHEVLTKNLAAGGNGAGDDYSSAILQEGIADHAGDQPRG